MEQLSWSRRPIIIAYWAVVLCAVPLWWYTTSIERLSLPAARVAAVAGMEPLFPVDVKIDTVDAGVLQDIQRKLAKKKSPSTSLAVQVNVRDREWRNGVYFFARNRRRHLMMRKTQVQLILCEILLEDLQ
jgi:phosphatidylinositol glycan class S